MKTYKLPNMTIAAFIVAVSLSACGKTNRADSGTTSTATTVVPPPSITTVTYTNTSTSTNTNVALDPPLSFEFTAYGGQAVITPPFATDNVLKVKFVPGTTQGNNFHSATELAVTLVTNNTEFTPKYTASNYTYGQINESSNVVDMSGFITPGGNIQITIKNPKNDYYCTYAPNPFYYWDGTQYAPTNPLYNNYPGCRRDVFVNTQNSNNSHKWSGKLIVQTSSTQAI
jgi:hypothetical protein